MVAESDWPNAAKNVLSVLRQHCGSKLAFGQEIVARRKLRLRTRPGIPVRVGNRDYLVARWFDRYSITAECVGRPTEKGAYEFESLSLVVVESPLGLTAFEPLMRVEWQRQSQDDGSVHAQPHWHVYQARVVRPVSRYFLVRENQQAWEPFGEEVEEGDVRDVVGTPLETFHFAMSALWHDNAQRQTPQYVALDACDIAGWTDRCLGYIKGQLEYLDRGRAIA